MARAATGQVVQNADGYSARLRIGPAARDRRSFAIFARGDDEAAKRAETLAEIARRLRPVTTPEEIAIILTEAGNARTEKALAVVLSAADAIASGETTRTSSALAPTFAEFALDWTSKDLHKRFPDHVGDKDAREDEQILRDYINPHVGTTRLPDVTLEHAERVMRALPSTFAVATRQHIAQCMRKVLSLAVYPGRHIASNPIPREWMPRKAGKKAKSTLFPEEDAKLVGCASVALERRLAYGILAREGMRASELGELRWRDVDLVRGRVRLDENKTDDPRAWALSPDVVRTLAWWKKRQGGEDADLVIGLDLKYGARWLRGKTWNPKTRHKDEPGDLRTAGVTRAELFERTASRLPVRLHDLRGTFVTVSLANGKTEQWVTDRTGHKSSQMLALYTRQARTWSEIGLGTLAALDELLPEMRAEVTPKKADPMGGEWAATPPTRSISADLDSQSAHFSESPWIAEHGGAFLTDRSQVRILPETPLLPSAQKRTVIGSNAVISFGTRFPPTTSIGIPTASSTIPDTTITAPTVPIVSDDLSGHDCPSRPAHSKPSPTRCMRFASTRIPPTGTAIPPVIVAPRPRPYIVGSRRGRRGGGAFFGVTHCDSSITVVGSTCADAVDATATIAAERQAAPRYRIVIEQRVTQAVCPDREEEKERRGARCSEGRGAIRGAPAQCS